ncbi:hypothetical protein B6672_007255 [Campylobacter jejuni]
MNKDLFLKNTQALFEVDQILAYKLRALEKMILKYCKMKMESIL